ncbi:hypothetical protein BHE97_01650 [Aeromicrobium sp. PE09-221]|uniref:hypothetical protein n=1 Tax=Aeromicrobium sp. PE09-221 TaxID=1898043 RepID=UPI000B3E964A|nr:hypothetical protein [Aeromicrobium sp. PE09-221]OUZ12442.1 hypothetical protein BHE97_01650 [Aeromicrobium sp. PE09-221]
MKALTVMLRGIAVASLVGTSLIVTAPTASAQNCSAVPGYAKRISHGVTEYYEDGRCGVDPNRLQRPVPRPAPQPPAAAPSSSPCIGPGIVCDVIKREEARRAGHGGGGGGVGGGGFVRVGPITVIGSGGSGGGAGGTGTVSVGPLTNPDKVKKTTSAQ